MTRCERISDRMPSVALGRSDWSADDRSHLDDCADCRAEWELVVATARLGASLRPLPGPEIMTAKVLGRLAGERAAGRTRRRTWLAVGLAAAAVAIIVVRIPRTPSVTPGPGQPGPPPVATRPTVPAPTAAPPPVATARQVVPLPELDDLPDAELESILGSLDESSGMSPSLDGADFDHLDDHELERVLGAWEG